MADAPERSFTFESFDGVTLAAREWGEGPTVLLLHGFAADAEQNWVRPCVVSELVGAGCHVVAFDARGHGGSGKPHDAAAYAGDAMVRDAQAAIDHLGGEPLMVCGYSMGAMTTLRLAGRDERVARCVLGGVGNGMFSPAFAERAPAIADALVSDDPSSISHPVARAFRHFAESTGADREALAAIQRAARPVEPGIRLTMPSLVICGDRDTLVGSPNELAEHVGASEVAIVSGDHLSAVNDPAFRETIARFLTA